MSTLHLIQLYDKARSQLTESELEKKFMDEDFPK